MEQAGISLVFLAENSFAMEHYEELTGIIVDEAFHLHKDLGPGLLESVYSTLLALRLTKRGLRVEREKNVVFTYEGIRFDNGLRIDLLAPVHYKQVLTYLKLMDLRVGLLINFGAPLLKQGIKRIVN
jgi:hypothetical protein